MKRPEWTNIVCAVSLLGMCCLVVKVRAEDRDLRRLDTARLEAAVAQGNKRPDFQRVELPVLKLAAKDPDALWKFLTDPETPYVELWAASLRCKDVFPLSLLPRLLEARQELRREERQHRWMLRAHPMDATGGVRFFGAPPNAGKTLMILEHSWTVPAERTGYPFSWEEETHAPWPWRTARALEQVFRTILPKYHCGEYASAWLTACMQLPCRTDDDAMRFVEATQSSHCVNMSVVARWRSIALDAKRASAGGMIGQRIGELLTSSNNPRHPYVSDHPQSWRVVRVVAEDILRLSPTKEARHHTAYGVPSQLQRKKFGLETPPPAGVILAASELALDSGAGDAWTRLYTYAFSVCEAVETPPFTSPHRLDPNSPQVELFLKKFERWFKLHHPELKKTAQAQHEIDQDIRKSLERLTKKSVRVDSESSEEDSR